MLTVILAVILSSLICANSFDYLESLTYDARFRTRPFNKENNLIKLVAVDRETVQATGATGLSLHKFNEALLNISKSKPTYVISLISPDLLTSESSADFEEFLQISKSLKNFIVLYDDAIMKGEENKLILAEPFSHVQQLPGVIGFDKNNFARDEVSRRAYIQYQNQFFLQPTVAKFYNGITDADGYRGSFDFKDADQIFINYQKPNTYKTISFLDMMNGTSKVDLQDKIVIIGYDDKFTPEYYLKTPYSRDVSGMSKLEANAQVLQTFIENSGIIRSNKITNFLITLTCALIILYSVMNLTPAGGLAVIMGMVGTYSVLSWLLFVVFNIAIGMAQPLLAIFVCYYFFIPYRLIKEAKHSWELSQKNKLLTQVEELKNNFLSMMSHDLKTPLARIQGMADIALAKKETLSEEQTSAIQTIRKSAEELTEFITNILDLSRVESQQIKLNLQPKDINSVLEDVIAKSQYLADQKNIQVITELEPLFTVKVDSELMRQVFSNLVENAIKYSPEGTKVLVSTEEVNGMIIVQVADQGIGITEREIKNIFTKFYRTKSVKNSQIKGSGLGLYLAKYFIELHKGRINVESIPQQGSTFTVEIPMNH